MITSRALFLRTALSANMLLAAQSMQAEVISSGDLPFKRVADSTDIIEVTTDLIVNESSPDNQKTALITINARSGGIQINEDIVLDAHPGPFNPLDPSKSSIYIDKSGNLEGTLVNEGHIRDGIFITGNSIHQTGNAFWSKGKTRMTGLR